MLQGLTGKGLCWLPLPLLTLSLFWQPSPTDTGVSCLQAAFNRLWRRAHNKSFKRGGDDNPVQSLMPCVAANVSSCKLG